MAAKWGDPVKADPLGRPLLFYCELRVVRADDLWLSQNTTDTGGDTLALVRQLRHDSSMIADHL